MQALVEEAMRKAAVAWLDVPGRPPYLVWCLWVDGSLYVVSGPDEQPAPGLAEAVSVVRVSARGDHGGRIVTWPARVSRVRPDSEEWDTVVPQLAAKRLNGPPARDLVERWTGTAVVSRLTPTPA
jgi:hypothetical protein